MEKTIPEIMPWGLYGNEKLSPRYLGNNILLVLYP